MQGLSNHTIMCKLNIINLVLLIFLCKITLLIHKFIAEKHIFCYGLILFMILQCTKQLATDL